MEAETSPPEPSAKRRQLYKDYNQQKQFHGSSVSTQKDDIVFQKQQKWPFLLWLYMKSLGLYHEGMVIL